jgi:MFS family permease
MATGSRPGRAGEPASPPLRRFALPVLCCEQFLVTLSGMIVVVALPAIQRDLQLGEASLQWVVNAYTLIFGGGLLLGGRLADLLGRQRMFTLGLGCFAAAALAAAWAPTLEVLLAARAVQGLGAALASPASMALVATILPAGPARSRGFGLWAAASAAGGIAGTLLGGILTDAFGWRAVFLVMVPLGGAAALVAPLALAESRGPRAARGLDVPGAVLSTAGLVLLIHAITKLGDGASLPAAGAPLAVAVALLLGFGLVERRSAAPLVRLATFRRPAVARVNLAALVHATGTVAPLFLGTLYLQRVLELTPFQAGLAFVPFEGLAILVARPAAWLVDRVGARWVAAGGFAVQSAGLAWLSRLSPDGSYLRDVLPGLLLVAGGVASGWVALTVAAVAGADDRESGLLSGIFNTSIQVGAAAVLALLAAVAAARTGAAGAAGLAAGYRAAFLVAATLPLIGLAVAVTLRAGSPGTEEPRRRGAATRPLGRQGD